MRTIKDVKQDWNDFKWMSDVKKTWDHVTEGMDETQKTIALYATAFFLLLGVVVNVWVIFGSKAKKVKNMKIQYSDKLILSPRAKTASKEEKSKTSNNNDGDSTMRGYKKTADGRTTTYFHREISEEEKKLLGDCKTHPHPLLDTPSNVPYPLPHPTS